MIKKIKPTRLISAFLVLTCLSLLLSACTKAPNENVDEAVYYTVKFNTVGGTEIAPMQILSGNTVNQPSSPTRDNYIFFEWLKGTAPYSFDTPVTEDLTLTARWMSAGSVFSFVVDEETGNINITGIKELPKTDTLHVPSVINGFSVTEIDSGAFGTFTPDYVTSVTVPESVSSIGAYAFEGFPVNLSVSGTITELGEGAFDGCTYLKSIKLGAGITAIPFSAFSNCAMLRSVVIPEGVELIDENAFKDCASMVTVVLPSSVKTVGDSAFHGCSSLKTVFFGGTEEELDAIEADSKNDELFDANIYFYSETESEGAWHFDEEGKPKLW